MFCSKCGNNVGEGIRFCEKCGTPVGDGQENTSRINYESNTNSSQKQSKNFFTYLIDTHKNLLKNYVNFNGRATRNEYWSTVLIFLGVVFALMLVPLFLLGISVALYDMYIDTDVVIGLFLIISAIPLLISFVYSVAMLIPIYGLTARRLHDTGKSGWLMLLGMVPYIGSFILLIFTILDSQPGDNQYGPNPKI